MRQPVPVGLCEWWDDAVPDGPLTLTLRWRGGLTLRVGILRGDRMLLQFSPEPADFTAGAERVGRLIGKALTRAGWRRPQIDPRALCRLVELRAGHERVEFILDTNALVEGVGHWLVDHFADRCDLVITAVTLRELQDIHGQATFNKRLVDVKDKDRGKCLGARQLYLAANRFRERSGYQRVLWRELEIDDTALLLSRGNGGDKSSESDTLLLRAVRRSIHDRVNNLERFFVTGDTALARRATAELPVGSVIAAQVLPVEEGEILYPCGWWPGPDQGRRIVRHPARLVWELLCIGDEVVATDEGGRSWTFQAFSNPMWPVDYLEPWIDISEPEPLLVVADPAVQAAKAPTITPAATAGETFWRPEPSEPPRIHDNLRIPAKAVLDLLYALVACETDEVPIPDSVKKTSASNKHVRSLLEGLDLATVHAGGALQPRARRDDLARAWKAGDLDGVFDLLRGWDALDEWATRDVPAHRPEATQGAARALAGMLGQGCYHPETRQWFPGGRRPEVSEMRAAVLAAVPSQGAKAVPIYTLMLDVFLAGLGVAPARVIRRWQKLWSAGVFEGFAPREGGTSSGQRYQEVAVLGDDGWSLQRFDLESVAGARDLVFKGTS